MELRNQLRKEWLEKQAKLKNQTLDFDYVYWDGSPHQRELVVKESFPKTKSYSADSIQGNVKSLRN